VITKLILKIDSRVSPQHTGSAKSSSIDCCFFYHRQVQEIVVYKISVNLSLDLIIIVGIILAESQARSED